MSLLGRVGLAVVLGAVTGAAQSRPAPITRATVFPNARRAVQAQALTGDEADRPAANANLAAAQQRLQEMRTTLSKMQALLKQMQTRTGKNSEDSVTGLNVALWQLMIGNLTNEAEQLQKAIASRQDLEARRAALYKQAEENAARRAFAPQASVSGQAGAAPANPSSPAQPASGSANSPPK